MMKSLHTVVESVGNYNG